MDSQTIETALGVLQADPDSGDAWSKLKATVLEPGGDLSSADVRRLLGAASARHSERGEYEAVAELLALEAELANGSEDRAKLLSELARVTREQLFDEPSAAVAYEKLLAVAPGYPGVAEAVADSQKKREQRIELAEKYLNEAETTADETYKAAMLMRAAELEVRFGEANGARDAATELLEQAVRLDPSNERAGRLLEQIYRRRARFEEAARVLERLADRGEDQATRVSAGVRLARIHVLKLHDSERAVRSYERVLREVPNHSEATSFLTEYYSSTEDWSALVALYERDLRTRAPGGEQLGDMLQIAMLHWRKRGRPDDAEPWFQRIAAASPAHDAVLEFYREYLGALEDDPRLAEVLQAARAGTSDPAKLAALAEETVSLATRQKEAQKSIERCKSALRADPDDRSAREELKRLYKRTKGHNALLDLLRQELDRTPPADYAGRRSVLREVAAIYRQYSRSETALVSVLNQIVQLDDKLDQHDVEELRELVDMYTRLERWRDLLTHQLKLADISPDVKERVRLYRDAGRRWLEQFSNAQNATEAYSKLLALDPTDREARQRLEELYRKRRAWTSLFELYETELARAEGAERISLMKEMAQLAADSLNRPADAIRLYREIVLASPGRVDVLEALERHAERAKDWPTVTDALERHIELLSDETARVTALQRLGRVYTEQLKDHEKSAGAWKRILAIQPGNHRALRVLRDAYLKVADFDGLEELYRAQNDWEGLAEVLSNAADRATDAPTRIQLSYRTAAILEQHLGQPERAFRSYERVLAVDPNDQRAARALIPLYEAGDKWVRVPALYEALILQTETSAGKIELLERLVQITAEKLNDHRSAVGYARRAYELDPARAAGLSLLEQVSGSAERWEQFVEALETRLKALEGAGTSAASPTEPPPPKAKAAKKKKKRGGRDQKDEAPPGEEEISADGEASSEAASAERYALLGRLARVQAKLGKTAEAAQSYRRALAIQPADEVTLNAFEDLLRRTGEWEGIRKLFEHRETHAKDATERVAVLKNWADFEEKQFGDLGRAKGLLEAVLDKSPADEHALKELPRLLSSLGDPAGAARVVERHRDTLEGEARIECELKLAELYLTHLARHHDALGSAMRVLESRVDPRAMSVLNRLMEVPATAARAAEVLATHYEAGSDARQEANALRVLLDTTGDSPETLALFHRLASVHEEKLGAYGSALDVVLQAALRFPREANLWDRAERLAAAAARPTDLAETLREVLRGTLEPGVEVALASRAARVYEEKLGDPMGAAPYLERVLVQEPGNEAAFERLKVTLTAGERWSELEQLYDRAARATSDLARRMELLVEVALITEEIMDGADKAARYYERVLEIDENQEIAIQALDRIYGRLGQDEKLAALLERCIERSSGEELLEQKLRVAKLKLGLHDPERALLHVEDVLHSRINDYDARTLAEQLLQVGNVRGRAARILEAVYDARNETRDLVRILGVRLEEVEKDLGTHDSPETRALRLELLRRIATLRDERMHDDHGAFDALTRLVPDDPLDLDARERLLEVGRRLEAQDRLADVLQLAAGRVEVAPAKGEILMQVAALHLAMKAVDRAEAVYRSILALDENDPDLLLPAARALETIYTESQRHAELAEILRLEVRLEYDDQLRPALLGRLGVLSEAALGDTKAAIEAWRTRLDENPGDEPALLALDELYLKTEQWPELVAVLERRAQSALCAAEKRPLLLRIAETQEQHLRRVPEAIETYQSVLTEFGLESHVLGALERLLETTARWHDLADALDRHLDVADSDAARLDLHVRLGDLRHAHLSDIDGAFEAYRRAIDIDRTHGKTRASLDRLLDSQDAQVRRLSSEILRPVYEAERLYPSLLRVLEIQAATSDDPFQRLEVLSSLISVARDSLGDAPRAFEYVKRALREAAGHADIVPWIAELDALAKVTGQRAAQVELLCEVVEEIFDENVQHRVTLDIAELARSALADEKLARQYFEKALSIRSDDKVALSALEAIFEKGGAAPELHDILARRVEVATSDSERKQIMHRLARLLSDDLGDKRRAISVYESILDFDLDANAIAALQTLYRLVEGWVELIHLYQRQLDAKVGSAVDLHVNIAQVASQSQNDSARAFDELGQALELEPQSAVVIAELERMLEASKEAEDRGRAASLLEPVYTRRADFGKLMHTLEARLGATSVSDERRELLTRLAKLHEEQYENYDAALSTVAKLLHDDTSDEWTISELERLAKVAGAERRLAEIYAGEIVDLDGDDAQSARLARRAGELFLGAGAREESLRWYRRALDFEPESRELFAAVDSILTHMEAHLARVELYRASLDHRYDPALRLQALHTIATLEREKLGRIDAAIETYREALSVEDTDVTSLDALAELYTRRESWSDLAELYLARAERSEHADVSSNFRLLLARLCRDRLGDADRAIDQLEAIVEQLPAHALAIEALEGLLKSDQHKERIVDILRPLYEAADDWRRLIVLNEDRFRLAETSSDRVLVLRETADLWERRGGDKDRARRAAGAAVRIDPEDSVARQEFERLTGLVGAWDQLAELYEGVLSARPELQSRRDILAVLASTHNVHRDDPRQALHAFDRLRAEDPTDLETLAHMERLATLLSDWPILVRVLTAKAEHVLGDEERASVWRAVAETKRDMLDDSDGAIVAYEKALEFDSSHSGTLDALLALYEGGAASAASERLAELYERRVDVATEEETDTKYELLMRAQACAATKLGDRRRAIDFLSRALGERPGDITALVLLEDLYRAESQWPDLLENLRLRAELGENPSERAALRKQVGAVLAEKLESFDDALDAYQMVLADLPGDEASVRAVESIGRGHEGLRFRVAEILIPTLEQTGQYAKWVDVLEMRLSVESDPLDRSKTLCAEAALLEKQLGRRDDALKATLRALGERPESAEIHADAERLSGLSGAFESYAAALAERAPSTFDPDVACDLYVRLGRVYEDKLSNTERAIQAYCRAVEQAGDQPELLKALDQLYTKAGQHQALADILERRTLLEASSEDQATLLFRLAELQLGEFGDSVRALGSLRETLERAPDHEAAAVALEGLLGQRDLFEEASEVLERVYRQRAQMDRLARLLELKVQREPSPGSRLEHRRNLARVLEEECGNAPQALSTLEQGVMDGPEDLDLLAEIERLGLITGGWVSAAAALRKVVDTRTDLPARVAVELCLRAATWLRDKANDASAAEHHLLRALEFEPENDEVWSQVEAIQQQPGRERDLIVTLRRRAALALAPSEREEICRRATKLCEAVGDRETSEAIATEMLAADDMNAWALAELTRLRYDARDFKAAFELMVRQADLGIGEASPRDLLLGAARLGERELSDHGKATAIYGRLFDDDPTDREASDALRRIYGAGNRWQELSELLLRLVDIVESAEERTSLRVDIARMKLTHFDDPSSAILLLQNVLEEDPNHSDAVLLLSELYEKESRDDDLADLLAAQIAAAQDRRDVQAELKLQMRLGEVYESRLGDPVRAIDTFRSLLDRQPDHEGALKALVCLHRQAGETFDAAQYQDRLFAAASGAEAIGLGLSLAEAYNDLGDLAATGRVLERCVELDPARPEARSRLEALYQGEENWDALARLLAVGAEFEPTAEKQAAHLRRAADIATTRLENPARAAELLDQACKLEPENREYLLELCDAYSASGRAAAAISVLERIIESYGKRRSKELGEIHLRLAQAYLAENNAGRAFEELENAFRIEPGNVKVLKLLGDVAMQAGDHKKAQQVFRALLLQRLDDTSAISKAEVFMRLGQIHADLNEIPKAIQMLERAIQTDGALDQARKLLDELKARQS